MIFSFKWHRIVLILSMFFLLSCQSIIIPEPKLRFIAAATIPNDAKQDGVTIGGLSSLGFDIKNNELFAVCDDSAPKGGPRIHHFNIDVTEASLSISSKRVTLLKAADGETIYPRTIVDAEGLVILPDGYYLVTSEGMDVGKYFALPAMMLFNPEGRLASEWDIPAKFMPKGNKMVDFGVRPNDAFESLTITPDQQSLFMANEKALNQDGEVPTLATESPIRVIKFNQLESKYSPEEEYVYHISALPMVNADPETVGFRSVSDMMAIDNKRLLVIEKTFYTQPVSKNSVQLYLAEITTTTTNVAMWDSLKATSYTPLKKELWFDLDQFEGTPGFPDLDNVEGIALGPVLDNGNQTLLLVTDNNFNPRQRTLFYAFEILNY